MAMKKGATPELCKSIKAALKEEPGQTVKDLAGRLDLNRQFMAGVLAVLEEMSEVYHRPVGPARIYFNSENGERSNGAE